VTQPGGRLLAAGTASTQAGRDFALARYRSDGSLDASFGTNGTVTTDFGLDDLARALIVQADGKVVAAGFASDYMTYPFVTSFALARYHANGTLDTSFGTGGMVTTPLEGTLGVRALIVQGDGKLVAAGDGELVRYLPNGSVDTRFGVDGTVIVDLGGMGSDVTALVAQGDKLVVAGSASTEMRQFFALARYRGDGRLDTSFGNGGRVSTDFADTTARLQTLTVRDGKLIAAGTADIGTSFDFALARYHRNGTLDRRFGDAGTLTTDFNGNFDEINALAWQTDGKLVATGTSYPANIDEFGDFALARYRTK
jgi:uncharacterized delta-60 repeat protein